MPIPPTSLSLQTHREQVSDINKKEKDLISKIDRNDDVLKIYSEKNVRIFIKLIFFSNISAKYSKLLKKPPPSTFLSLFLCNERLFRLLIMLIKIFRMLIKKKSILFH